MSPVRIIGVGSPFGQDQLGWQAAEALLAANLTGRFPVGFVTITSSDRPGAALLAQMRGADCVLIIDALQSGATPGTIRCLEQQALADDPGLVSSHDFGVSAALELGQVLGDLPGYVRVLGIEMDPEENLATALPAALIQNLQNIIINQINTVYSNVDDVTD